MPALVGTNAQSNPAPGFLYTEFSMTRRSLRLELGHYLPLRLRRTRTEFKLLLRNWRPSDEKGLAHRGRRDKTCDEGSGSYILRGAENGMKQNRDSNRTRGIPFRLGLLALWVLGPWLSHAAQSPETIQKIQQLLQQGDSLNAQALLSQALKESPGNGGLYNLQGVIKAQEGDFPSAEANFRKAIQLAPGSEGAYLNLGRLYQEHIPKDPRAADKALSVYTGLLRFAPDPGLRQSPRSITI
jgi:tetratricopeptide (TPR) repeat protein